MKIKAKWGFIGDAKALKTDSPKIRAGQTFEDVDKEYAHGLIGKGLAVEVKGDPSPTAAKPAPRNTKPAAPSENK